MISAPLLIASALLLELLVGWPAWLYSTIRHPVVWMGTLISYLDMRLNNANHTWAWRYAAGCITTVMVVALLVALVAAYLPAPAISQVIAWEIAQIVAFLAAT